MLLSCGSQTATLCGGKTLIVINTTKDTTNMVVDLVSSIIGMALNAM